MLWQVVLAAFRLQRAITFVLVCAELLAASAPSTHPTAPLQPLTEATKPAAVNTSDGSYLFNWEVNATNFSDKDESGTHVVIHQTIQARGSMIVRVVDGIPYNGPIQMVMSHQRDELDTSTCLIGSYRANKRWFTTQSTLTGSTKYSAMESGEPRFFQGKWYIDHFGILPFSEIPARYEEDSYYCIQGEDHVREDYTGGTTLAMLFSNQTDGSHPPQLVLTGDATGTRFEGLYSYTVRYSNIYWSDDAINVQWHITAVRLGSCATETGPIDATNPIVTNMNVAMDVAQSVIPPNNGDTLDPPKPATVTISVTCDDVPVRNADLRVAVKAESNSGGHNHEDDEHPRPRGYLKGSGNADFVEITAYNPSIAVRTDNKGTAVVRFLPGRDLPAGGTGRCAGLQRGIAGTYLITATPIDEPFRSKEGKASIKVKRMGLEPLPSGDYFYKLYSSKRHPEGTSGTPVTFDAIKRLASDFHQLQVQHNEEITKQFEPIWPFVDLAIIDVSLPDGGLYDSGGKNVCDKKQPVVDFVPWHIPHQTHLKGTGVDISTKQWIDKTKRYKWWRNTLRAAGCYYGTWAKESTFHLDVDQNPQSWGQYHQGCTYTPETFGVAAISPLKRVPLPQAGTLPDLTVDGTIDRADDRLVVAAGQEITYTVGISNMFGGADAHNVVLNTILPADLHFVRADPAPTRLDNTGQPVWEFGSFLAGALPQIIDVVVQVDPGVTVGSTLQIGAVVTSSDADAVAENNTATPIELLVTSQAPDLIVDTDIDATAMTVEQPAVFTLQVDNAGAAPASNTVLKLTLPVSVTLENATPPITNNVAGEVTWNLGTLESATTRVVTVAVQLERSLESWVPANPSAVSTQKLVFKINAQEIETDSDPPTNARQVSKQVEISGSDVAVSVQSEDAGVATILGATDPLTYTVVYGNFGNQIGATTVLTASLAPGLNVVSIVPAPTRLEQGGGSTDTRMSWNMGDLAVGASGIITFLIRGRPTAERVAPVIVVAETQSRDVDERNNLAMAYLSATKTGIEVYLPIIRQ